MSEYAGQRKHPQLTRENVLAWMEYGREYTSRDIAKAFGVEPYYAWEIVKTMRKRGDIERVSSEWHGFKYAKPKRRVPLDTTVAGPQMAPDLRGTLTGYEAEIRRRAELCMAARGR